MITHIPVLASEVLKYLDPKPNDNFIDATIDGGGHSAAILKKTEPNGKILGIDMDAELIERLKVESRKLQVERRLILVNDNFKNLSEIVKNRCPEWNQMVAGIIFDLGMSSWHLEKSERGFSFKKDEVLDMRFRQARNNEQETGLTAREIVNLWQESEIEKILREYGEERYSRNIAKKIIEERKKRPILTTFNLVEVIKKAVPGHYEMGRINPATRTFQALRIAVNKELDNLKEVLPKAIDILKKEGRIVVISFHSLEDRIVKNFFRQEKKEGRVRILTKKPVRASEEESQRNPRSRSAKLRAAEKTALNVRIKNE